MKKSVTGRVIKVDTVFGGRSFDRAIEHTVTVVVNDRLSPGVGVVELSWEEPTEHRCRVDFHCERNEKGKWKLIDSATGDSVEVAYISHCPFCGVKLP
jgi:hypothetical protein